jgi:ParB/RepB/Spo0J family partition protein
MGTNSMKDFLKNKKERSEKNLIARGQTEAIKSVVSSGLEKRLELVDELNKSAKYMVVSYKDLLLDDKTFQNRAVKPNLEDLKAKLQADGQQVPIFVRPVLSNPGKYQIISGFSRAEALTELKKDIAVKCYNGISDKQCLTLTIDENIVRNDMKPADIIKTIHKLESEYPNLNGEELAAMIGKRRSTYFNLLKIEKHPEVLKALNAELITLRKAIDLSTIDDDKSRNKALAEELETNKKNNNAGNKEKKPARKPQFKLSIDTKKRKFKLPAITGTYADKEKVIQMLEETIIKLKEIKDKE